MGYRKSEPTLIPWMFWILPPKKLSNFWELSRDTSCHCRKNFVFVPRTTSITLLKYQSFAAVALSLKQQKCTFWNLLGCIHRLKPSLLFYSYETKMWHSFEYENNVWPQKDRKSEFLNIVYIKKLLSVYNYVGLS